MSVELRLCGEPDEIAATLAVLRGSFEVATRERTYPNRGGFGVRVYAEVRPVSAPTGPVRASARRVDGDQLAVSAAPATREITQ